jgi:hypothetical protein
MGLPAVDLDDEGLIAPEEVHDGPLDRDVYFRLGKAMAPTEGEHPGLELRPRSVTPPLIANG